MTGRPLRVVTAQGLSLLNAFPGPQRLDTRRATPPADHHDLADRLIHAIRETGRTERPCAELTPLPAVWKRYGGPEAVEVVLVAPSDDPWHQLLHSVLAAVADAMPVVDPTVDLTFRWVDSGGAGVEVGEAERLFLTLPNVVIDELTSPDHQVVVNGSAGPSAPKQALASLAALTGVDVFITTDATSTDIAVMTHPPVSLDRAESMRRVDAADHAVLLARLDEPGARTLAKDLQVTDLVLFDVDPPRRSHLADWYADRATQVEMLQAYPASAALLDRFGHHRHADTLRRLVDRWVRQRLWSLNLCPELVAHDDRHVERVDHLLASLAMPLLASGTITPDELVVASCAAWLHDWGHVGADLGGVVVTDPADVRATHGLLTQSLIASAPRTHQLVGAGTELGIRALDEVVGTLCAHHQSWSSCGPGAAAENRALARLGVDAPSFHDAIEALRETGLDIQRAELLLALLRVADGCDIGVHRVPNVDSIDEHLTLCARRSLARIDVEVRADDNLRADTREALQRHIAAYIADPQTYCEHERDNLDELTALTSPLAQRVADYIRTVMPMQHDHFVKHNAARFVRIDHRDERWVAMVVPNEAAAGSSAPTDPRLQVDDAIRRELDQLTAGQGADRLGAAGLVYGGTELT